jgi:hypothetical protein
MKANLIKEKSFAFCLHSIELNKLLKEAHEFTLANQFFKVLPALVPRLMKQLLE